MDISNLSKNLSRGLEQKNNVELTALSRVLDLALGKVTSAQVTEVVPVNSEERQALLNKTAEALSKLAGNSPLTPAAKQEMAQLLEQQNLLKSPDLKWVSLLVNNRQLLTYSDKPLAAGQTVTVRLVTPEKLVLIDLPEADAGEIPGKPSYSANTSAAASSATYSSLSTSAKSIPSPAVDAEPAATIPAENGEDAPPVNHTATPASAVRNAAIQMAAITEIAPITAAEQQELLKKTEEELTQLAKIAPSTPGLKEAISSLVQQQALIKSPDTKWVHLLLNNQSLLTYSDKALEKGQALPVQIITPQQIVLLDLPEAEAPQAQGIDIKLKLLAESINSALAAGKAATPSYFATLSAPEAPPPATQNLSKTPVSSTAAAAPASIQMARVTEAAPLLAQERTELLQKTAEELVQLSKMASASAQPIPGLKEAINALLQQQALIKAPGAKWIHLQVKDQSLLTYSDKPLVAGQTLAVHIVTPQKIQLLDPAVTTSSNNSENSRPTMTAQKPSAPTYFAQLTAADTAARETPAEQPLTNLASKPVVSSPPAATPVKIQMATVTETAPLVPAERAELLKKTAEELAQLARIPSATPGVKEAIASLLQQQTLLKSPDSQWLHLRLNGQTLLTYSDKPLSAGQAVPVQVLNPQKLVLLDLPDSNLKTLTESLNATLLKQTNLTPTYYARLADSLAVVAQGKTPTPAREQPAAIAGESGHSSSASSNLTTPKIQLANVSQTLPLSADERQELLKKTAEELSQLNKMASTTPGVKEAIDSLRQQQTLLSSPQVKWVHLQINNQTLLTYSDKPVSSGQTLPVQVITPQKIQLLDLPHINNAVTGAKTFSEDPETLLAAQKNATPTYFAKLAAATPAATPAHRQDAATATLQQPAAAATSPTSVKIETATVITSTAVSPQQRQQLLQKIDDDLTQLNKLANNSAATIPSVKELLSTLLQQQAMLKSPNLQLLQLSVDNRPLTTYSDQPLRQGQNLALESSATQKIAILNAPEATLTEEQPNPAMVVKQTGQGEKMTAQADSPDHHKPSESPVSVNQWQDIPNLTRQLLTAKTLEQALKSIAEQIRSQLQQPTAAPASHQKVIGAGEGQTAAKQPFASAEAAKSSDKALAKTPEKTVAATSRTQLLEEIDQLLSGTQKKLSTELTAKVLQELIRLPAAPATAAAPSQANTNSATAISQDQAQDLERMIQQLLNKPDGHHKEVRAQLLQLMQYDAKTVKDMDIGKLTQHLSKGLEQKNSAELAALSRTLNITLGKVAMADVSETAPVTPAERKELLAKTSEALAQLTKANSNPAQLTPATKAAITQLLEQQALIKSPDLKWANLLVNNRPVLTYTDKPLSAGQTVPVQLVDAQRLVLLTLPGAGTKDSAGQNSAANLPSATPGTSVNLTYTAKPVPAAALTELAKNAAPVKAPGTDPSKPTVAPPAAASDKPVADTAVQKVDPHQIKQVVADHLRRLLPYQDTPNLLLNALPQWQKLPAASQQRLASLTVEQALKSVAEQIRSPLQIIQPKVLADIIKNSGVFFENVLSKAAAPGGGEPAPAAPNSPDTAKAPSPSLTQTFNQDLKGALLTLLSRVNQELSGSSKPLSEEQTVKLLQHLSNASTASAATSAAAPAAGPGKGNLPIDLGLFIQQVMTKPVKELSDKELRTHLLTLLQHHSVQSLAKIQLQQLASLNSEASSREPAQTTNSWQIEIPVRHHNEVQQLQLRLEREWVDEQQTSSGESTVAKVKQWSVTLRFDLPTLGEFCAQLSIIDTSVSATLWASEEKTFGQVRRQLDDLRKNLEKEGINVKQLHCMKGMPAAKPMALSYSLIDIST